jgi:methylamine--corrinoid protein Co-methyltransferase
VSTIEKGLNVYETFLRSEKGPRVTENVWDNKIVPNAAAMLREKYDINFGDEFIPTDPDLKKRLFLAGMDMLVSTGIYNVDTGRVVKVTEEEVRARLRTAPRRVQLGEYRDMAIMKPRKGNSPIKPIVQGGPTGATVSEDMFIPMIQSYAQEQVVDTIVNGVMATIDGIPSTADSPFEVKATLAEIRSAREACSRAGRPYMSI